MDQQELSSQCEELTQLKASLSAGGDGKQNPATLASVSRVETDVRLRGKFV